MDIYLQMKLQKQLNKLKMKKRHFLLFSGLIEKRIPEIEKKIKEIIKLLKPYLN